MPDFLLPHKLANGQNRGSERGVACSFDAVARFHFQAFLAVQNLLLLVATNLHAAALIARIRKFSRVG
jgi:hypothetical protein